MLKVFELHFMFFVLRAAALLLTGALEDTDDSTMFIWWK
jgi:hypothetical protein